jgi:hypothetical protein
MQRTAMMAGKGGLRSTSFKPTWNVGKTRLVRLPDAWVDEYIADAKAKDEGRKPDLERMLVMLEEFVEAESESHGLNQHRKGFSIETRDWKKFKKFKKLVEQKLSQ